MSGKPSGNDTSGKRSTGWYLVREHVLEHPFLYATCVLSIIVSTSCATYTPKIIGDFTDAFSGGILDSRAATRFGFLIAGVSALRVAMAWLGRFISMEHGRILNYKVRDKLFKKWETLPVSYYQDHSVGDLISHSLNDVLLIQQMVALNGFNNFITGIFLLIGSLYVLFVNVDWSLAIVGLAPLLAIPFVVHYFSPRIKKQSAKVQETIGGMSQSVEEFVGGIRTIKAFGNESVVLDLFGNKIDRIMTERVKLVKLSAIFTAIMPLMVSVGFVIVIAYGGYLAIHKVISLGNFVSFLLYLILLRQPLEQLGNTINQFQSGAASLKRVAVLLDAPSHVSNADSSTVHQPTAGHVEVRNLSFRYPKADHDVLTDISFSIKNGETLGIVGPIGSGKTTMVNLLTRIYNPPKGTIFMDGVDVHDYSLDDLRHAIAFVPQGGFLFSTSIEANIAFSDNIIDSKKVGDSAKTAVVHNDIERLKDGYKTEIGERGVRLSGGQKQRVSIARAIYKDSPIHILDDSLSAVDTSNEQAILQNLRRGGGDRTNIIISHRLSAVRDASEIIILDGGRITGRGTHQQLLESNEYYSMLWKYQSGQERASQSEANQPSVYPGIPCGSNNETVVEGDEILEN